ncbi:MAG: hypothetical protein J0I34_01040 [Pseudonocardia sp.]|uniref:hypothetical protein n=1 Tax=unclassified Pseudonocardia TaxID=2619320 RepID=UPI00086D748B|nr:MULTISPECIES: hypothetical protein [unclassified Pseudonocardia]MBN9107342.1 hypothetical protein [Pseudonocardia sp.]ODV06585.1 MAG: hypothetical protein ABT15_12240 [Pseudonocardia sp. SCN 73-27]
MSVIVVVEFPGARVDAFTAAYQRHAETMTAITMDGKGKGALHHMIVENENGDVMVVDEWETREQFDAFFAAQDDIRKVIAEVGLSGPPRTTSYRVIDTADRF